MTNPELSSEQPPKLFLSSVDYLPLNTNFAAACPYFLRLLDIFRGEKLREIWKKLSKYGGSQGGNSRTTKKGSFFLFFLGYS